MYAMTKICTSNHIITKTRRGFTQKFDTFDRNSKSNQESTTSTAQPKPIFHLSSSHKFKEANTIKTNVAIKPTITPQHEELIKYLNETWNNVIEEYQTETPESSVAFFDCKANVVPKFEPFDLESFWSQRFYQQIISS